MIIRTKALLLVPMVVSAVITAFLALGYLVTTIIGVPFSFGFALPVRLLGVPLLASGFLLFGWLFMYRKPIDILVSTYSTISKAIGGVSLERLSGRTEPLVVQGPYLYLRHPLYLGVVLLVLGWWLVLDYSFLLFSAILLLLWFSFFVAHFEEKELRAIFGEQYEQYSNEVPRMIPFTKRHKKQLSQQ